MRKILLTLLLVVLLLVLNLFWIRAFGLKEIDDVTPEICCENELIKKSDVLWIIPKFNNTPISENKEWCSYILSLNKTLGLHGVYHTFEEFGGERDETYIQEGIEEFEKCFGFKPELFKPPQLKITPENKELIENKEIKIKGKFNQLIHKVYHCEDTGKFSNRFIDFF